MPIEQASAPAVYPTFRRRLPFIALICLSYALMVSSALEKSATVDEPAHIFRGVAYGLTGASQFWLGNPVVGDLIAAAPALLEPALVLPTETAAWEAGDWSVASSLFLFERGNPAHRLIFLARLTGMWFTLVMIALVFRFARDLALPHWMALGSAALVGLDPNMIAHGRLVTNDVAVAGAFLFIMWGAFHFLQRQKKWGVVVVGVGLGIGVTLKFTTGVAIPVVVVLALISAWRQRSWRPLIGIFAAGLLAWVVMWALFGFALRPLPGGAFWDELLWQLNYLGGRHGVYLNGEISNSGWASYFLVALLVKTPLPTLLLGLGGVLAAAWLAINKKLPSTWLFLAVPPLVYLLFTQGSATNIGYRYLLPMIPFVVLFGALIGHQLLKQRPTRAWSEGLAWLILLVLALQSGRLWPDYLPFFNLLAGGTAGGGQILSDSNIDWGQDLPALAEYQQTVGQPLFLSYFGTAYPSAYGLDIVALPTWPAAPEQRPPLRQPFVPSDPAPGWYALSLTNLHGAVLGSDAGLFDYFKQKNPDLTLGGSLFLFRVEPTGPPLDVAVGGVVPYEIDPELMGFLPSNDRRIRWFDPSTAVVAAAGETFAFAPVLAEFWVPDGWLADVVAEKNGVRLWRLAAGEKALGIFDEVADLTVASLFTPSIEVNEQVLNVTTRWQIHHSTARGLKIFVHVLNDEGAIIGQYDGLGVESTSWRPGDVIVHRHQIIIDQPVAAVRIGLYDGATGDQVGEPWVTSVTPFDPAEGGS